MPNTETNKTLNNLVKNDWIKVARGILIENGIANVGVRRLSSELNVSTGAFYWLYKNLGELHEDLRNDWKEKNTKPFTIAQETEALSGLEQYLEMTKMFIFEKSYDPNYDNAIREWARTSPATAIILAEVDQERIDIFRKIFEKIGFNSNSAEFRARVYYYHQVGYQAMRVNESTETRLKNLPFYNEILTGKPQ